MRFVPRTTPVISARGGSTSLRAVLGVGPKGADGANVLPTDTAVENALAARGLPVSGDDLSTSYVQKPTTDLGDWALLRRDTSDVSKGVAWTTSQELIARTLGWAVVTDARYAGAADPTGVIDSGPAINAAINAVKVAGGKVYMPPGTYKISTVINMSGIHTDWTPYTGAVVALCGAGHQATVLTGGETGYGFIELVGSNRVQLVGFSINSSGGAKQYGILGGRTTGDSSAGGHVFSDVYVYGNYTLAGVFMMSAESCTYDQMIVYTIAGPAFVAARDLRGWTASAKYTPLSASTSIGGGNGVITVNRCLFVTIRTPTDGGTWDSPFVLEYAQTFKGDGMYLLSSGAPLVLLDKGCHQASFKGMHQEWNSSIPNAVEPYGLYVKDTTTGTEPKVVRVSFEDSSLYPFYGEDNQQFSQLSVRTSGWRGSKTYMVDVYSSDTADLPVSYTRVGTHEVATPLYRRRAGAARMTRDTHVTPFATVADDQIYPIPTGAKTLTIRVQGPGGGGGSGSRAAAGANTNGGGGGGTGGYSEVEVNVADLGVVQLYVSVRAGGAGGAAVTADSTNGATGSNASSCWVALGTGGSQRIATAAGGFGGNGGGPGGSGGNGRFPGQTGASASGTGGAGQTPVGSAVSVPGAGGSGGGLTTANAESAGGAGFPAMLWSTAGAAGGAAGANGSNGTNPTGTTVGPGNGGGGGGSSATAAAGAGGNGGYGAGGGGGGASRNGFNSGKGGDGGQGFVTITARF